MSDAEQIVVLKAIKPICTCTEDEALSDPANLAHPDAREQALHSL